MNKPYHQNKVWVVHPGTQHSQQLVKALNDNHYDVTFFTQFYFKNYLLVKNILRYLPTKLADRLKNELLRRRKVILKNRIVKNSIFGFVLTAITNRLFPNTKLQRYVFNKTNTMFSKEIAKKLKQNPPIATICFNGSAREILRKCKEDSIIGILDQPAAHYTTASKLFQEEKELSPTFTDSLINFNIEKDIQEAIEEVQLASYILVPSEYVKSTLLRINVPEDKIFVIPYGVDISQFKYIHRDASKKELNVLFIGGITQRKGIRYLLDAIKNLIDKNYYINLTLLGSIEGSGKALKEYRNYFTHVSNVPHHQVSKYLSKADVFILPSLSEGSSLAAYEAMASGLPAIVTTNSGSVIRDGIDGYVVPIRDTQAIIDRIKILYNNRSLAVEMGQKARERVEEFTWKRYHKQVALAVSKIIDMETKL